MKRASEVSEHDPATHTKSKLLKPEKWDTLGMLFKSGGHMPLIGYFGNKERNAAAVRRDLGSEPRSSRAVLTKSKRYREDEAAAAKREARSSDDPWKSDDPWGDATWSCKGRRSAERRSSGK